MRIHNLTTDVEDIYFDEEFLVVMESYITHLRQSKSNRLLPVTLQQCDMFKGDFMGLLDQLYVPKRYHHIVTRVNGFISSGDFKGDITHVIVPDPSAMDSIKDIFMTKKF